jgi:predicted ATP-dependent serine protease
VPLQLQKTSNGCYLCRACMQAQPLWTALCQSCGTVGVLTFEEGQSVEEFNGETIGDDDSHPFIEDDDGKEKMPKAMTLGAVEPSEREVIPTGLGGLDAMLDGGLTVETHPRKGTRNGTSLLLYGRKGAGKTKLAILMLSGPARRSGVDGPKYRCAYVSGEEDTARLGRYAKELGAPTKKLQGHFTHNLNHALHIASKVDVAVLDSAQQLEDPEYGGARGSARQVNRVLQRVSDFVKETSTVIILLSQVTKGGDAKGGESLGHDTDVSLKIAKHGGEDRTVLFAGKNRFGSASGKWRFRIEQHGSRICLVDREKKTKPKKGYHDDEDD